MKEEVFKQEEELQVHVESQADTFAPETVREPEVDAIQYQQEEVKNEQGDQVADSAFDINALGFQQVQQQF